MVVLVAHQDTLAGAAHAMLNVVFLEAFQASNYGWIFFRLRLFDAKCIVGKREQRNFLGLVGVEGERDDGRVS